MREFTFYKESAQHHLRFNSNFFVKNLIVNKKINYLCRYYKI